MESLDICVFFKISYKITNTIISYVIAVNLHRSNCDINMLPNAKINVCVVKIFESMFASRSVARHDNHIYPCPTFIFCFICLHNIYYRTQRKLNFSKKSVSPKIKQQPTYSVSCSSCMVARQKIYYLSMTAK